MKKIQLVLLVTISAFTFSCGNDDDAGVALTQENFEGEYNLISFESSGTDVYTDPTDGTVTTETYTSLGSNFNNSTFTFNANNTVELDLNFTMTFTYNGQADGSDDIVEMDSSTYILNVENETLSIEGELYQIESFNGSDLILTSTEEDIDGGNRYTYESEIILSK